MIAKILLFIARQVLRAVLQQLAKQMLRIAEEAIRPMQNIVQLVSNPNNDVWRGAGAQKFAEVVSSSFIPGLQKNHDRLDNFCKRLDTADTTIEQADGESTQMVRSRLFDRYNFYSG